MSTPHHEAPRRNVTAEELLGISSPGKRYALVKGELIEMEPAGGRHGQVAQRIARLLGNHVDEKGLGIVFAAETGFHLERDPDTVLAPDVAFVSRDRLTPEDVPDGYPDLAPDLVVEVVSPSDTPREVTDKAQAWVRHGVLLVWVVDPRERSVRVFRGGVPTHTLGGEDRITGDPVLPGLSCPVTDFVR